MRELRTEGENLSAVALLEALPHEHAVAARLAGTTERHGALLHLALLLLHGTTSEVVLLVAPAVCPAEGIRVTF